MSKLQFVAVLLLQWMTSSEAFAPIHPNTRAACGDVSATTRGVISSTRTLFMSQPSSNGNDDDSSSRSAAASASAVSAPHVAFPVISKIAGLEWTGSCRYVNTELAPLANLKLSGGVKYDIINGTSLTLSSFLTFPNGKTREVVMRGERKVFPPEHEVITLRPTEEEEGPIVMKLSEVYPDTILINEVERASGNIVMTSSVSIVQGLKGLELVGVSHEVGDNATTGGGGGDVIEGHQLWRMTARSPVKLDEFDYNSATSW